MKRDAGQGFHLALLYHNTGGYRGLSQEALVGANLDAKLAPLRIIRLLTHPGETLLLGLPAKGVGT